MQSSLEILDRCRNARALRPHGLLLMMTLALGLDAAHLNEVVLVDDRLQGDVDVHDRRSPFWPRLP